MKHEKGEISMKRTKISIIILILLLGNCILISQYKSKSSEYVSAVNSFYKPISYPSLTSWFNPQNFRMNHSFSLQYFSFGGAGNSIASYTNSMFYQFSNNLNARLDISLMGSPFGDYRNNFSKLFISRAEINYRPLENFYLQLQYRQMPMNYYDYYLNDYWYRPTFYNGEK